MSLNEGDQTQPQLANRLSDLSFREPISVPEDATLAEVAWVLIDADISCVVLVEPPLRVVTERDLARAWVNRYPAETPISAIAIGSPLWATPDTHIAIAAAMMIEHGVRHLVIVNESTAASGIVSMRDLFKVLLRSHEPATVFAQFATIMLRSSGRERR